MPTPATGLAGMTWVDLDHPDTTRLRFVRGERIQLGKCPTVQFPLVLDVLVLLATPHGGGLSDMGEILENECCASRGMLNNTAREDMIAIAVESLLFFAQLLQVAFGRLTSVRL